MAKTLKDITPSLNPRIKLRYNGKDQEWMVIAHDQHKTGCTTLYPVNCVDTRAFDAKEPNNPNSDRKSYGNNNWELSNLRAWLNSDSNKWYEKTHQYDQAPTNSYVSQNPYADIPGYLAGFDKDLVEHLETVSITTARPSTDGGGSYTTKDKVILLSRKELFNENENGVAEGKHITLFNSDSSRKADTYYWTRSPDADYSNYVRFVYSGGSLHWSLAYRGYYGVRPALVLKSSISVEDRGNGLHEIVFNTPPTISNKDVDLGSVTKDVEYEYTVFDKDNDKLSIVERLNNKVIASHNDVASGQNFKIIIDRETIYKLPLGQRNTLQIEVRDEKGATAYRNVHFTRTNSAPIIQTDVDANLGEITQAPVINVKIKDPEGDAVDATILINDMIIQTIEAVDPDKDYTIDIPSNVWAKLGLGNHKIVIKAIDAEEGYATETILFSRVENEIDIAFKEAVETEVIVKIIVPIVEFDVSDKFEMAVYATNNGLDDEPNWEDVTTEAKTMQPYVFKNQTATGKPAFAMRVTVKEAK